MPAASSPSAGFATGLGGALGLRDDGDLGCAVTVGRGASGFCEGAATVASAPSFARSTSLTPSSGHIACGAGQLLPHAGHRRIRFHYSAFESRQKLVSHKVVS